MGKVRRSGLLKGRSEFEVFTKRKLAQSEYPAIEQQLTFPGLFESHAGEVKIRVVSSLREPLSRSSFAESPQNIANYWRRCVALAPWYDDQREMAVVICVNTRHAILSFSLVSIGTLNETLIHPRDVFRPAIAVGAFGVIFMHNHPSGITKPGRSDIALTKRLDDLGNQLAVPLIDHVIVAGGTRKFFSFVDAGLLFRREPPEAVAVECP
jgi:DNA repair protein RadC